MTEERDLLDIAQDIFEFNLNRKWTEEDELCDFYCNAARLDAFFILEFKEKIENPRQILNYIAINNLKNLRNKYNQNHRRMSDRILKW